MVDFAPPPPQSPVLLAKLDLCLHFTINVRKSRQCTLQNALRLTVGFIVKCNKFVISVQQTYHLNIKTNKINSKQFFFKIQN